MYMRLRAPDEVSKLFSQQMTTQSKDRNTKPVKILHKDAADRVNVLV